MHVCECIYVSIPCNAYALAPNFSFSFSLMSSAVTIGTAAGVCMNCVSNSVQDVGYG
jgi:hypothetical protein